VRDYSAELLQRTLRDFRTSFTALTPPEQAEALQCVLKGVTVHPRKLALEIFELDEFHPSSQNRKEWLPGPQLVLRLHYVFAFQGERRFIPRQTLADYSIQARLSGLTLSSIAPAQVDVENCE
jgi:hypothetical protein